MLIASITPPRIHLIDALRALALLGILVVHTHDHYNLYVPTNNASGIWEWLNVECDWLYETFFLAKAYLLFSFLFGVSFFIQMESGERRGENIRLRFLWRLAILFFIGILHSIFYAGDILTSFAVLGIWLLFLHRLPTWIILIISTLCLLRIPGLIDLYSGAESGSITQGWGDPDSPTREWIYGQDSWTKTAIWNLGYGMVDKVSYCIYSGRYWQMLGLFPLGMLAGRYHLFTAYTRFKKRMLFLLGIGGTLFLALSVPPALLNLNHIARDLLHSYANLAFLSFIIGTFSLLLHPLLNKKILTWLSSTGRMTLSCYLLQTLVFTFIFFGWGLGLAASMSPFYCLLAAIVYSIVQAYLCKLWMQHFRYGPAEWAWRSATLWKKQDLRKHIPPCS